MPLNPPLRVYAIAAFAALGAAAGCSSGDYDRRQIIENAEKTRQEVEFGRLIALKIVARYPLLADEKAVKYVAKVGKAVALFAGRSDIEYHFGVLDTNVVNAYAAPGGYIFITRGAIVAMKSEAQLAGVLGHEIAHVNDKHMIKMLPPPRETKGFVDRVAAILSAQGTTVSSVMSQAVEQATDILFKKGLQQADEYEADRHGLTFAAETGYQPEGLPDYLGILKALKNEAGGAEAYNTHPPLADRIAKLNEFLKSEKFNLDHPRLERRFQDNLGQLQ